jgi:molybdenum cofactor synthesis domain-containing protein
VIRVSLITVSDSVASGEREDRGAPACEQALKDAGIPFEVVRREALPDDRPQIARAIRLDADAQRSDLVILTGGTGVAPRDRTPEAIREVIEFEVPGLAEKMRRDTGKDFPAAYLSRQVVGVRAHTLIVAVPGSPKGATDCLGAIAGLLSHAIELIRGERANHPKSGASTSR